MITWQDVVNDEAVKTYIKKADESLTALGYTEHSFTHVGRVAQVAGEILTTLGYPEREVELAKIAGYLHDIGNVVNRTDHAQSGAIMAFRILDRMGMEADEISTVITAIGNHDESTAFPVNAVAAALILADKTDVRFSRVRNHDFATFDIHDRVNYAVTETDLKIDVVEGLISFELTVDENICSMFEYFEIFLGRMMMCRKAAEVLGAKFTMSVNGSKVL